MQVRKTGHFRVCSAQFLGKREFSQTSPLCHFELIINSQLHARYQKNIMNQSLENYVSIKNGSILGISGPILGQTRILSKQPTILLRSTYQPSTSYKISKISNERILRKLHKYRKRVNFGYFRSNFRANKNSFKPACYVIVMYLSTLNFMQISKESNIPIYGK